MGVPLDGSSYCRLWLKTSSIKVDQGCCQIVFIITMNRDASYSSVGITARWAPETQDTDRKDRGRWQPWRPQTESMTRKRANIRFFNGLPLDINLADSCRTNSGILCHWHSERHLSISVSSREPDFRAVIFPIGWWECGLEHSSLPEGLDGGHREACSGEIVPPSGQKEVLLLGHLISYNLYRLFCLPCSSVCLHLSIYFSVYFCLHYLRFSSDRWL